MAAAWLLVIICGIIVMFQSFKLIFEMAERYFILAVLTILAPVAFGVGGSRNTSDIFAGWCRMYGSMCLLMILNVMFIKMLLSVLSFYPSGVDVLPWMVLCLDDRQGCQKDRRDYHPHRPESGNYRGSPWANLPRRPDLSRYENSGRTGLKDHWEGRRRIQPRQAAPYAARQSQRPQVRWFRGRQMGPF